MIVHALEKGTSQRVVAEKFKIAKSTVADIWKDRDKTHFILALLEEDHLREITTYHVALIAVQRTPLYS